ncbi:hypothetical protein LCGC14_2867110, partial [marine sediment metagenome]
TLLDVHAPVRIQTNKDSSIISVDEDFVIYASIDFGETWSILPINKPDPENWSGMTVSSMYSHNNDTILVGAEVTVWLTKSGNNQKRKILRTTNGGQDWIVQYLDDSNFNCCGPLMSQIDFLNDTIGIATGNNLIIRTTNIGGELHIRDTVIYGSVEDYSSDQLGISIFPNPTSKEITVSLSNDNYISLDIFSMTGKLLKTYTLDRINHFDISDFEDGIYILRFKGKRINYNRLVKTTL